MIFNVITIFNYIINILWKLEIYYLNYGDNDTGIYKTSGENPKRVTDSYGYYLNKSGAYIYYIDAIDNNIVKMKTNGKNKTIIVEDVDENKILVVGKWIYYFDDDYLYRVKTNGQDKKRITEKLIKDFQAATANDEDFKAIGEYLWKEYEEKLYADSYGFETINVMSIAEMSKEKPVVMWTGIDDCYYCQKYAEELKEVVEETGQKIYYLDFYSLLNTDDYYYTIIEEKFNALFGLPTATEELKDALEQAQGISPSTFIIKDGVIINVFSGYQKKNVVLDALSELNTQIEPEIENATPSNEE